MKVALGSDHAGFLLKEAIKKFLEKEKIEVLDQGAFSEEPSDYPSYALEVARCVQKKKASFGVLVCGTGIGMAIAANRIKGIRAVNGYDVTSVRLAREHNNANILTLGGRLLGKEKAEELVKVFLNTPFSGGRHKKRIEMIDRILEKGG